MRNIANILQSQYKHTATIKRNVETETAYGETIANNVDDDDNVPIYTDIKCYCSQQQSKISQGITNNIDYTVKLFTMPNYDIKTGDVITVTFENNQQRTYKTGEPLLYLTHQEIALIRNTEA